MSIPITAVTNTAATFAEDAVEAAFEVASEVASDAVDLATDLAVPAMVYGTKKFLTSRLAVLVVIGAGVVAGLIAWRRSGGNSDESVTSSVPNISDRQPA